ncbi:hypothetical protein W97_05744 [Coniosporium apollinis CBS 100218]|uniref:MINDY deubiquitinase domain-containing protein n=1 Tax=Coniosporium apollinis (strain CBS 100218) TaxID=1168221 RepID=R7YXG5_CONA1|nr:uncharacterized protein W97_05744 [Coniosporium apollinis CBS 100218]EON66499.1 hypothetical protein W97_05744 [Coniosporium apollinis CBS 100218]
MVMKSNERPDLVPRPLQQAANNPPYPTTPNTDMPPTFLDGAQGSRPSAEFPTPGFKDGGAASAPRSRSNSDVGSVDTWDTDDGEDAADHTPEDLPAPLKVAQGQRPASRDENGLPAALRVGPPDGVPRRSQESQRSDGVRPISPNVTGSSYREPIPLQSQNPYLRMQSTGQSSYGVESSASIWGDVPASAPVASQINAQPVELPSDRSPVEGVSKLSLNTQSGTSSGQAMPPSPASKQPPLIPVETERPSPEPRHHSNASSAWDPGMDISSLDAFTSRNHRLPSGQSDSPQQLHRTWQEQQAWEQKERERREMEAAAATERAAKAEQERKAEEEWHRGEQAAITNLDHTVPAQEIAPELPPRTSTEGVPQPKPPRPQVDVGLNGPASSRPEVETPITRANRQRKEHYQIKHIHWYDANKRSLRPAPILIQNANGPCPLLALVNALVLTTPAGEETALIETLRTREQVSLGLLLDAVFDELMSGRRGGAAQELPDVGDLYGFLITLHTGMNVNPRFVAPKAAPNLMDSSAAALADVHPALRGQARTGGFEETKEMRLYSTFSIPLIHGWIPPSESGAYAAFERSARTFEDAQNIQFREEELEHKLQSHGLSPEEQNLYEDIHCIKDFLERWPTQLTDYGLETISKTLQPGQVAILFRNDHFSTLYKEPRTHQLLTLVTDAGYSTHDEIVWESLVDVNGQGSELYSGDFRPVGGASDSTPAGPRTSSQQQRPVQSMLDVGDSGWTTVQSRNRKPTPSTVSNASTSAQQTGVVGGTSQSGTTAPQSSSANIIGVKQAKSTLSKAEQEDHDLALALQLQEEEEDRLHRETEARRRREDQLTQQLLSHENNDHEAIRNTNQNRRPQGQEIRPLIPPRRSGNVGRQSGGGATGQRDDLPPPTYEQAASGTPYHPPRGHPASPHAPISRPSGPGGATGGGGRQQSAYMQQAASTQPMQPPMLDAGRRRSSRPLVEQVPSHSSAGPGPGPGPGRRVSGAQGVGRPGGGNVEKEEKCVVM